MRKTMIIVLITWQIIFGFSWAADQIQVTHLSRDDVIKLSKSLNHNTAELTVKGKIKPTDPVFISMDTIMRLPTMTIKTTNHWTGKQETFSGIGFIDLLRLLGLERTATKVEVIAVNNYRITIRLSDIERYEYVLSYMLDGKCYSEYPPEKNKGPIAVAINFDKHPELDREIYKHQLVWFVSTIIVK